MLQEAAIKYYHLILNFLEKFTNTKFWMIKSTIALSVLAILTSFPDYNWYIENQDHVIFERTEWHFKHPFQQLPEKYIDSPSEQKKGSKSHADKLWSRVTIPVIAYLFGLNVFSIIIIQHILFVLFFYLILKVSFEFSKDKIISFLIASIFASTYTGKWGIQEFASGDGIAYFILLFAMWKRSFILIFMSILLTSFIDERALIASSLVYLWWHLKNIGIERLSFNSFFEFHSQSLAIIFAWITYFLIRYFLLIQYFGLKPGTSGIGIEVLRYNFKYIPMGFFTFLEFAWFFVLGAYIILLNKKKYSFTTFLFLTSGLSFLISFLVFDVSRSIGYAFPILLISLYILWQTEVKKMKAYILGVSILCFLLPTHAVFVDGIQWLSPIVPKIFKLF